MARPRKDGVYCPGNTCAVPDCGRPFLAKGFCQSHYNRFKAHGDPLKGRATKVGEPRKFLKMVMAQFKGDNCVSWPYSRNNEGRATIRIDGRTKFVCRLICTAAHGNPPTPKHHAAHSCGNGHLGCVSPKHLLWKTVAENAADRVMHGTLIYGEAMKTSKLTNEAVRAIRQAKCKTRAQLAEEYGVNRATIDRVINRDIWKHVD